jgi:hypothetical protein
MSTKGALTKRARALGTSETEHPPAAAAAQQNPAKKNKSAAASVVQAVTQAASATSPTEQSKPSTPTEQSKPSTQQTVANPKAAAVEGSASAKKDETFKRLYTSTVQDSYLGNLNIEDNNLNKPGTVVFALSLLQSKFGKLARGREGDSGSNGERTDETFRRECVEPHLEKIIASAEPQFQGALKFIISAAKSDITSKKDCCCEGGAFPIMQEIKIKVLNTMIGFSPFEWNPAPGKYNPDEISGSYFVAVKKMNMMIIGHPLFRFQDKNAEKQYFQEYMDTVYNASALQIEDLKENRRREIEREKQETAEKIQSLEQSVLGIRSIQARNAEVVKDTDKSIQSTVEKIDNAQKAHETMAAAINNMMTCMDCDSNQEMYQNMKEKSRKDLETFVEKQNGTISELGASKLEIEKQIQDSEEKIQEEEAKIIQLRASVNDTDAVSRLEAETGESIIKSQISDAIDLYVKTFDPILQCIESSPNAKQGLMRVLKTITESDEVIQEGILAMRNSIEVFLEDSISAKRAESSHPPPPIPSHHLLM